MHCTSTSRKIPVENVIIVDFPLSLSGKEIHVANESIEAKCDSTYSKAVSP